MKEMNVEKAITENILTHLTEEKYRFEMAVNDRIMETLAENLHEEYKALNAIQKTSGYETTLFLRKEIKLSKVLTNNIQLVQNKLNHREVNYDAKEKSPF